VLEDLLHPIAVRERIEALLRRTLVDVLRMLIVAHEKERVDAAQPLVSRDDVTADLLVGRSQVWAAVDVINCGGEIEARHECPNP